MDFKALARRFDSPGVQAIVLMDSHARGDAGPYSDIDLVRFGAAAQAEGTGSHLIAERLVVVSHVTWEESETWFVEPALASATMKGLQQARALLERGEGFRRLQERAWDFKWDIAMQARADRWASRELVGLIEEVHKGLEGLRRGDAGRLLNARFGLSWVLSKVVQVQRGVLVSGDNGFFDEVAEAVGRDSLWVTLRDRAFATEPLSLQEQVKAGLRLYLETVRLLAPALGSEDAPLVLASSSLIRSSLEVESRH